MLHAHWASLVGMGSFATVGGISHLMDGKRLDIKTEWLESFKEINGDV